MQPESPHILTVNAGSSSLKLAVYANDADDGDDGICGTAPRELHRGHIETGDLRDDDALHWIKTHPGPEPFAGIGHRLVHGGPHHHRPCLIDDALLHDLRQLTAVDPGHLPAEIGLIETLSRHFPGVPQFACFDTDFHHDLPRVAQLLPLPRRYEKEGLRRYGFHGLSYAYLMQELARRAGPERPDRPAAAGGRVVLAHLGSGASLAAVHHGRPVDTTMAFTPAAGVPMSTRAGDLDPGLAGYFARVHHLSAEQFDTMVTHQSGLLGVSETSGDLRDLLAIEDHDPRAAEAVELFCYAVRKQIGAYAAALGGLDTLVFSGGIGEHAPTIRRRVCAGLCFLGIAIQSKDNDANASVISAPGAEVAVHVIPTDESQMIARSVCRLLHAAPISESTPC